MYEFIHGVIRAICPTYIILENQGIGYKCFVANPYRLQSKLHEEMTLFIEQIVREDAITLYGFLSESEKFLFQKLLKVSGIGPKSAISILASENIHGFSDAVEKGDVTYLTKFPGVGKKTAQQIIIDLKGTVIFTPEVEVETPTSSQVYILEAKEALLGLGYSQKELQKIWKVLEKENVQSTEEMLRKAFVLLMK